VLAPVLPDNDQVTYIGVRTERQRGLKFLRSQDRP
jgi:hypothetical protein